MYDYICVIQRTDLISLNSGRPELTTKVIGYLEDEMDFGPWLDEKLGSVVLYKFFEDGFYPKYELLRIKKLERP